MITYDKNGGDLGRALLRVTALEMQIVVPHVANLLDGIAELMPGKNFKYAFELPMTERGGANFVIGSTSYTLPPHVFWYDVDGIQLFEIRSPSGGVTTSVVCYLVTK